MKKISLMLLLVLCACSSGDTTEPLTSGQITAINDKLQGMHQSVAACDVLAKCRGLHSGRIELETDSHWVFSNGDTVRTYLRGGFICRFYHKITAKLAGRAKGNYIRALSAVPLNEINPQLEGCEMAACKDCKK